MDTFRWWINTAVVVGTLYVVIRIWIILIQIVKEGLLGKK